MIKAQSTKNFIMKERELYWGFSYHKQTLTLSIGASHENDYDVTTMTNIAMKLEILINWFIFLTSVVFFALAINDVSANGYTFKRQVKEHLATEAVAYADPPIRAAKRTYVKHDGTIAEVCGVPLYFS